MKCNTDVTPMLHLSDMKCNDLLLALSHPFVDNTHHRREQLENISRNLVHQTSYKFSFIEKIIKNHAIFLVFLAFLGFNINRFGHFNQ